LYVVDEVLIFFAIFMKHIADADQAKMKEGKKGFMMCTFTLKVRNTSKTHGSD
jgi:hypothetical protein